MDIDERIEYLLHPRVIEGCGKLFHDGHYTYACLHAFKLVETAAREMSGCRLTGRQFARLFKTDRRSLVLRTPFGKEMQEAAGGYFGGAFHYYRNFAAHEPDKMDRRSCLRALVAASELLDLLGASALSFEQVGGLEGLVTVGAFTSKAQATRLLRFLDGYCIVDDAVDGFFEDLFGSGFSESQMHALIDVGLIRYVTTPTSKQEAFNLDPDEQELSVFCVIPLGNQVLKANISETVVPDGHRERAGGDK